MRHFITLGFLITDLVLYYHAYLEQDRGVLGVLTVLWWVSLGLAVVFSLLDLLNGKFGQIIFTALATGVSAYVFFAGVLNFQQWALALSFWVACGGIAIYAIGGAAATAVSEAEAA